MRPMTTLAKAALLIALGASSATAQTTPSQVLDNANASYVQRSLDKVIVYSPTAPTYTIPAPRGSGTRTVVEQRDCRRTTCNPPSTAERERK